MLLPINPEHPEPRKIQRAVDLLNKGGVIAYPTDTVYKKGSFKRRQAQKPEENVAKAETPADAPPAAPAESAD